MLRTLALLFPCQWYMYTCSYSRGVEYSWKVLLTSAADARCDALIRWVKISSQSSAGMSRRLDMLVKDQLREVK